MLQLDETTLERIRRNNPTFDLDQQLAQAAVRDCGIAYFWNPFVSQEAFAYLGWSTSLYAGVDDANRTAHVVFRGTDQPIDWAINLAFLPLPFDHPLAHGGFVAAWRLAKRRFMPWLREQSGRIDRVVVAGHSLGGALALVCAYELQREGFEVARCITVGAPRVYTRWSVATVEKMLGGRLIRVCREQDVVPKMPPAFLGFRHIGEPSGFIAEILGQREPDPLPTISPWFEKAWYYATGGRIGQWLSRHGVESTIQTHLTVLALSVVAGLGAVAALLVQVSVLAFLGASSLFVVISGVLVALAAHRSGHYVATRTAASLVEEWQIHSLRDLAAGRPHAPAREGKVRVELSVSVRADHGDDNKRRLIRKFRRLFGAATFQTVLGQCLEEGLRTARDSAGSGTKHATPKAQKLDLEFKRVGMSLLLYGYSSEEIDRMLDDGVISRPKRWNRYYATSKAAEAPRAAEGRGPGTG